MGFSPNTKGRAFIAVVQIGNFIRMGLDEEQYKAPEYLGNYLCALWENSGRGRSCAVAICESEDGLYHAHMALYGNTTTLKKVSDVLFQSHVEPQLGGKKELSAYMMKIGKYAEKGEKILYLKNMDAIQDVQGKRNDLEVIEEMLVKGMTPQEILDTNFRFYRHEKMILRAYTDQRIKEAPVKQDVYVEYHVGNSGTGKTYFYKQLCDTYGVENIYVLTDYDNGASGGLDSYMKVGAPDILFMDEFKGVGITYGKLLTMLNGYSRMQVHARYENAYALWQSVYITSVYPIEKNYEIMVDEDKRNVDSYEQLIRRISKIVYHYKENGEYKAYSIDASEYINYDDLKQRARGDKNGFMLIDEAEDKPPFN